MFYSVLFPDSAAFSRQAQQETEPECFKDLNLGQVFEPIFKANKDFGLESLFYTPLQNTQVIAYRQDVMRELENDELRGMVAKFAKTVWSLGRRMDLTRKALASGRDGDNNYLAKGRMLDYAQRYCHAVSTLSGQLAGMTLRSEGLRGFSEYILSLCSSQRYKEFYSRVERLRGDFSAVEYCMLIKNGTIRVRKREGQPDLSEQIIKTFEKFRQGDVKDYRQNLPEESYAAHVEAAVLNMVAGLYRDTFADLNDFCKEYIRFDDETLFRFAREVQFYLSWLDYIRPLRAAGLPFQYPEISETPDDLYNREGFDIALAAFLLEKTVKNDFMLKKPEQIIVVTGPNQGGKTTFARAFGQTHYLASLGLCVPGREAKLYLFDHIFTHFSREEDISTLNGKLQDDLVRLRDLLSGASERSIIIINEIFTSTTVNDAVILGRYMMDALTALKAPAVIVTFLDEIANYGANTVSMMSMVEKDDLTQRTFKIVRKPPDGLAFAIYIAGKHGLTYELLNRRLKK